MISLNRMPGVALLAIVLATVVPVCPAAAQSKSDISKKQNELQSIRDQIRATEEQIKQHQRTEKASLELLDKYDRKAALVRRLINQLRSDAEDLQIRIDASRVTIGRLEQQFGFLQEQYARYVTTVYKSGPVRDLELLISSRSLNQLSIRNEYLRQFSRQRKNDADRIVAHKHDLEEVEARLQVQLGDQRRLIEEKGMEEDRLASLAADRRDMVAKIRKDRQSLQKSMERQIQAAREIEGLISKLIEEDRIRRERKTEKNTGLQKLPQPSSGGSEFAGRRGKLRWPVDEGSVVAQFGPHVNPKLKTITQNTGIDIAVKAGSRVTAVAEGEIATIQFLPWYGSIVIVNHAGGYRTIYTHLADIRVNEGQHVKEGELLAESGESVDGPRLHFEIWKDHDKQDPELWLSKR
jgi:septal ring factor EnvC (AmiA/AmiB activator)